jgi:hypothetical protein
LPRFAPLRYFARFSSSPNIPISSISLQTRVQQRGLHPSRGEIVTPFGGKTVEEIEIEFDFWQNWQNHLKDALALS